MTSLVCTAVCEGNGGYLEISETALLSDVAPRQSSLSVINVADANFLLHNRSVVVMPLLLNLLNIEMTIKRLNDSMPSLYY